MHVNPINSNQTNFKGQFIFKKSCIKLGKNFKPLHCLSVPSESIKMVGKSDQTIAKLGSMLDKLSPDARKRYPTDLKEYKTIILTSTGNNYLIATDYETLVEAKRAIDGTSKFMEL